MKLMGLSQNFQHHYHTTSELMMHEHMEIDPLRLSAAAYYIPKKNPQRPLGEDAHFVCLDKQTIGVADGVGGWSRKGIDPGDYARCLMRNSFTALSRQPDNDVDLKRVLRDAFSSTRIPGSSTACIITLKKQTLRAINVGDSGFMVFRNRNLVYKSRCQHHSYNCPYQLGLNILSDKPRMAEEMEVPVVAGDIVVAGTDGLFDNIHQREIEEILLDGASPEHLAWSIGNRALHHSLDAQYLSPFAEAAKLAGKIHRGGKRDDITVVVGIIET